MTPDDFMAAKSKEDSITACAWLCKGFALFVACAVIYQIVKWIAS